MRDVDALPTRLDGILSTPYDPLRHLTTPYDTLRNLTKPYETLRNLSKPYETLRHLTKPYYLLHRSVAILVQVHQSGIVPQSIHNQKRTNNSPWTNKIFQNMQLGPEKKKNPSAGATGTTTGATGCTLAAALQVGAAARDSGRRRATPLRALPAATALQQPACSSSHFAWEGCCGPVSSYKGSCWPTVAKRKRAPPSGPRRCN